MNQLWRITFGDYDFALDRRTLTYSLTETKTGTVWAENLRVGWIELEEVETETRTRYDFGDAKIVSLSEKSGPQGKRILIGLDFFGVPVDLYFICSPKEIQLTVEAARDTRTHRVGEIGLFPGLVSVPDDGASYLVAPQGGGSILFPAEIGRYHLEVWTGASMPFVGAVLCSNGDIRTNYSAISLITDSAYASFDEKKSGRIAAFDTIYRRDPERRRLDVRLSVLPHGNHISIARAYRSKIIDERNHMTIRKKMRDNAKISTLLSSMLIMTNLYKLPDGSPQLSEINNLLGADSTVAINSFRLSFGLNHFVTFIRFQNRKDGYIDAINQKNRSASNPVLEIERFAPYIDIVIFHNVAYPLWYQIDGDGNPDISFWEEMEKRLSAVEAASSQSLLVGTEGFSDWTANAVEFWLDSFMYRPLPTYPDRQKAVPLFSVCYHDSVIRFSEITYLSQDSFLYALLNIALPYFQVSKDDLTEGELRFYQRSYVILSQLSLLAFPAFLTEHRFLTRDMKVEEAIYSDKTRVVINQSNSHSWKGADLHLPPLGFYIRHAQMEAHYAFRVGERNFAPRVWHIRRSHDGLPLETSQDVRAQEFVVEPVQSIVNEVAIGFGSNHGDREANLRFGRERLAERGVQWRAISSIYETDPVGPVAEQPPFLNQVGIGETKLSPKALLQVCRQIERERGRDRGPNAVRWGPRTLDLDILLYGQERIATAELTVPHPEMTRRAFVMVPLSEIAPDWVIPQTEKRVAECAATVEGREGVRTWRSFAT